MAGDFNRDGKVDLLSGFSFVLGSGSGQFYPPLYLSTPLFSCPNISDCGATIKHSVVLDVNGDGLPDFAYVFADSLNKQPSQVLLFVNAGQGDGILASSIPPTQNLKLPARNSIASLYGIDLSPQSANAGSLPLPTSLGGVRVHIGDQLAQLFSVSPSQINYLVPDWPSDAGPQFYNPPVSIERSDRPYVPKGISAPSIPEAPALFSANAAGLAAAYAVRVGGEGAQSVVPVLNCSSGRCVAIPIDTWGDPVYLSLFATGLNNFTTVPLQTALTCTGGTVTYVGPQGQTPGLQQINLRLDKAAVRGIVTTLQISCSESLQVTGTLLNSNSVNVQIQ